MNFPVPTIISNNGDIEIGDNVIGFSIEPAPGSDDNFSFGVDSEPTIKMFAGDGSREFGFLENSKSETGFDMHKPCTIKIKFEGTGSNPGVLLIQTNYLPC